ncbi:MAG: DUF554 domain-containing protein [Propionivibrio sp.]
MLGPLVNSAALMVGAISGALLGRMVPRRVKEALPLTCGMISLGIGAVLVNKVQALPAVSLALIAGALIGELLYLERGLELSIKWVQKRFERTCPGDRGTPRADGFIVKFVTISVLFCASGMGIFGATHEGMTGEPNILLAKSVLDLFTAMIFATELGFSVALIAAPQIAIQSTLYLGAHLLMPLTTPAMLADFSACGGIVMLATGLRICGIKIFPIVNMLPALLLVMPVSALWARFFA